MSSVRPWNAPSKQMTACRPVAAFANLTAFSTASAPELNSATFRPGPTRSTSRSRELDVDLVRHDGEVGVGELRGLALHGLDDLRMRVPDQQAAEPAREIEHRVAVDVGDRGAEPVIDDRVHVQVERIAHDPLLALDDRARPRTGQLGLHLDRGHTSSSSAVVSSGGKVSREGYRASGRPAARRSARAELPEALRGRGERVQRSHQLLHRPDQPLEPSELRRVLAEPASAARARRPAPARTPATPAPRRASARRACVPRSAPALPRTRRARRGAGGPASASSA